MHFSSNNLVRQSQVFFLMKSQGGALFDLLHYIDISLLVDDAGDGG